MDTLPLYRLVLHPQDRQYAPNTWEPIIGDLQAEKFLGNAWGDKSQQWFLTGDRFVDFVTFMGCSPYIVFEPPQDGSLNFCHVQFSVIHPQSRFRSASGNVFARCPHCGKRLGQWEAAIKEWEANSAANMIRCDKCHADSPLYQLGWRHTAGFGRVFIDIFNIYPQEGVPTDSLLGLLHAITGVHWQYFYTDR